MSNKARIQQLAALVLGKEYGVTPSSRPKLSPAAQQVADFMAGRDTSARDPEVDPIAAEFAAALASQAHDERKPAASKPSAEMSEAVDRAVAESLARRGIK